MKFKDLQISISLNLSALKQGLNAAGLDVAELRKKAENPLKPLINSESAQAATKKLKDDFLNLAKDLKTLEIGLEHDDESSRDALNEIAQAVAAAKPHIEPVIEERKAKEAIARLRSNIAGLKAKLQINPNDEAAQKALNLLEQKLDEVEKKRGFKVDPTALDRLNNRLEIIKAKKEQISSKRLNLQIDTSGIQTAIAKLGQLGWALEGIKRITGVVSKVFRLDIGASFEEASSQVRSIMNATAEEMKVVEKVARDLGATTAYNAMQAMGAAGALAANGLNAEQVTKAMRHILHLTGALSGRGGFQDMADAADLTAAALKNFNLQAVDSKRVADVFVRSTQISALNAQRLINAMGQAGPAGGSFNQTLEQTVAALAVFHDAGIKGERAGTAYKAMLSRLTEPAGEVALAIKSLKLKPADIDPAKVSFGEILQKLKEVGANSVNASGKLKEIFGQEHFASVQAAIRLADTYKEKLTELENSQDAAKAKYDISLKNLTGATKAMGSALEELYIQSFNNFSESLTKFIKKITGVLQSDFAGAFFNAVSKAFDGIFKLFNFLEDNAGTILSIGSAIGILTLGIKANAIAVTAQVLATKSAIFFTNVWKGVQAALNAVMNANPMLLILSGVIAVLGVVISKTIGWAKAFEYAKASILIAWEYIKWFLTFLVDSFINVGKFLINPFITMQKVAFKAIKTIATALYKLFTGDFKGALKTVIDGFESSFDAVTNSLKSNFSTSIFAFSEAGKNAKKIWNEVGTAAQEANEKAGNQEQGKKLNSGTPAPAEKPDLSYIQDYEAAKLDIQTESNLQGLTLLQYRLQKEQEHFKSLGELTKENAEKRLESEKKILELEKEITAKKIELAKQEADEKQKSEKAAFDFEQDVLALDDPYAARLNRQKQALIEAFEAKKELLKKSGKSEEEIAQYTADAITELEKEANQRRNKERWRAMQQMGKGLAATGKIGFKINKAINIAYVISEAPAAAHAAAKAVKGIPVVGPALAPIAYAASMAQSAAAVKQIEQAKPPKYAEGGGIEGKSHAFGGVLIEAEGGEFIISAERVRALGRRFLNFLNFGNLDAVKQSLANISFSLPPVPQPAVAGVYAAGGMVNSGVNNDNSLIIKELQELKEVVAENRAIFKFVVKNRSKIDVHEENLEAEKAYNKRKR